MSEAPLHLSPEFLMSEAPMYLFPGFTEPLGSGMLDGGQQAAERDHVEERHARPRCHLPGERGCIDNLLVRIYLIIEMVLADRPCAIKVLIPFSQIA